jgi:dipeptidyl aminopeptidase/acylaminoacyl peptidase
MYSGFWIRVGLRMTLWCSFVLFGAVGCRPAANPERPADTSSGGETILPPSEASEAVTTLPSAQRSFNVADEPDPSPAAAESAPEALNIPPTRTTPDLQTMVSTAVPLIPRSILFGNPERARVRLSPDGNFIAFLAPVEGVLNVWVGPANAPQDARPVTADRDRGIREYFWAYTSRHLIYLQDEDGDEDFHAYRVDLESREVLDLTPLEGIAARVEAVSEKFPEEIIVGINDRDGRQLHDVYRVNLLTGHRELVLENPGFAGFLIDDDYRVRLAVTITPDAGQLLLMPDDDDGWKEYLLIGAEDAMSSGPAGFDKTGRKMYFIDSRERNTAALTWIDLDSGEVELLAEDPRADVGSVLTHPTEKHVQAVAFDYARQEWKILDQAVREDFEYLEAVADGDVQITGRTLDDRFWTVAYLMDNGPARFYLYNRPEREATFLFTTDSRLDEQPLVKMQPVIIPARDGLELVSYLTLPPVAVPSDAGESADFEGTAAEESGGIRPEQPLPMVLLVHGGPWARDDWGYHPEHQLLANRGYAVLSVNFRGSTGFGKQFINAADQQWGAAMHDDLMDAVQWAIDEKIADPARIAIMGGSYGGYATLVGLTMTPEVFACGVDIVGPSNLVTLLENPPPYWMPIMPVMQKRVGDYTTEQGRKFLEERSPLFHVDRIQRPLLIGQGRHDPRVKQAESDQIVSAMQSKEIPVTYLLFLEEGHGFARPENRFAFYAVAEAFLAEHLGGRCEPLGDAIEEAVLEVPAGADQVPGLSEALRNLPPRDSSAPSEDNG